VPELQHDLLIERPLEGHDQVRHLAEIDPLPGREFRVLARDVDLALFAGEAEGVPLLLLTAILALPERRGEIRRQIVSQPALALRQQLGAGDAGLLSQLAPGGVERRLALVDPALRHLPGGAGIVEPLRNEHLARVIEQRDADSAAIGQRFDILGRLLVLVLAHHFISAT
jgi:hypothetical protein